MNNLNKIIISILLLNCFISNSQNMENKKEFKADSIFIYSEFKNYGRAPQIIQNHKQLENNKSSKVRLDTKQLEEFNTIFKGVKRKRKNYLYYGAGIYYSLVYYNGVKKYFVFTISEGEITIENIIDRERWTITNSMKQKQLNNLLNIFEYKRN